MKKSKGSLVLVPATIEAQPVEDVPQPELPPIDAIVEVEGGATFISTVGPVVEEAPALVPESCQFCGARNLIDIRRNYYCANCGHETSK